MTGYKGGDMKITFPDSGQVIEVSKWPDFEMHGMMKGTRTFSLLGDLKVEDKTNGYYGDFIFNPDKKGWFKRMFTSSQKSSYDRVEGIITNCANFDYRERRGEDLKKMVKESEGLEVFGECKGSWLEEMKIGKETFWKIDQFRAYKLEYVNNPLPSDCRFRIDLIALLNGDLKVGQENKDELENLQRDDRKMRKDGAPEKTG